jgi:hypothetical protein
MAGLSQHSEFQDDPTYADWATFHAQEIKDSGRRLAVCRVCKTVRVPVKVHACHVCY